MTHAIAFGLPVKSVTPDEAAAQLGGCPGMIAQLDSPVSSAWMRERLGWKPAHPDLLADIADGHSFTTPS